MRWILANLGRVRESDGRPLLHPGAELDRLLIGGITVVVVAIIGIEGPERLQLVNGEPTPGQCKAVP